jgi:parallel beta-helix repeat protein
MEVVKNRSLVINGNLVVKAHGNLTLKNVTLVMNNEYAGQYGISVEQGGSMSIYYSKISPADLKNRFTFAVKGNSFVMKNTELRGVGWCKEFTRDCYESSLKREASQVGLLVQTAGAVIEDNLISDNVVGIILNGPNISVKGNTFRSNEFLVVYTLSSQNKIFYNDIHHNRTTGNPSLASSIIKIMIGSNGNTIAGNTYVHNSDTWPVLDEVFVIDCESDNNVIANNTVSSIGPAPGIFPLASHFGSNNTIVNNTSIHTGGIFLLNGANNRVERNKIPVLHLQHSYNTVVVGNRISGQLGTYEEGHPGAAVGAVVALDHSSNNLVLNNLIESKTVDSSLLLWSSKNNTIRGNTISNGSTGIFLYYQSDGNLISNNDVKVASSSGASSITVDDSSSNIIYENNFVDEKGEPYDNGNNTWTHEGKGNFWKSHRDQGNTPYKIPPKGVDKRPLTNPVVVETASILYHKPISVPLYPSFPGIAFTKKVFDQKYGKEVEMEIEHIVIENRIMDVEAGHINIPTNGSLTIRNSTLILGRNGSVPIGAGRGSLTIERSRLISHEKGYGFWINSMEGPVSIRNSEIHGAVWADRGIGFDMGRSLIVENSIITSSRGVSASVKSVHGPAANKIFRVVNNTFIGNYQPVQADNSENVFVAGNIIYHSLLHKDLASIEVAVGREVTIIDNTILRSRGHGINFGGEVWKATIIITGNTVSNVAGTGLIAGGNGTIYRNNFISNPRPAASTTPKIELSNRWDHNGQGNYWGGYSGRDADLDGIGETPQEVAYTRLKSENREKDNFPFMRAYGWLRKVNLFDVVFEQNRFQVIIRSNSSIAGFNFTQHQKQISYYATGRMGSGGASDIVFPKRLLWGPYFVLVNGSSIPFTTYQNETHTLIAVSYIHGPVEIEVQGATVIPEFPSSYFIYLLASVLVIVLAWRSGSIARIRM